MVAWLLVIQAGLVSPVALAQYVEGSSGNPIQYEPFPGESNSAFCSSTCSSYNQQTETNSQLSGSQVEAQCAAYNSANQGEGFEYVVLALEGAAEATCLMACMTNVTATMSPAAQATLAKETKLCKNLAMAASAAQIIDSLTMASSAAAKAMSALSGVMGIALPLLMQKGGVCELLNRPGDPGTIALVESGVCDDGEIPEAECRLDYHSALWALALGLDAGLGVETAEAQAKTAPPATTTAPAATSPTVMTYSGYPQIGWTSTGQPIFGNGGQSFIAQNPNGTGNLVPYTSSGNPGYSGAVWFQANPSIGNVVALPTGTTASTVTLSDGTFTVYTIPQNANGGSLNTVNGSFPGNGSTSTSNVNAGDQIWVNNSTGQSYDVNSTGQALLANPNANSQTVISAASTMGEDGETPPLQGSLGTGNQFVVGSQTAAPAQLTAAPQTQAAPPAATPPAPGGSTPQTAAPPATKPGGAPPAAAPQAPPGPAQTWTAGGGGMTTGSSGLNANGAYDLNQSLDPPQGYQFQAGDQVTITNNGMASITPADGSAGFTYTLTPGEVTNLQQSNSGAAFSNTTASSATGTPPTSTQTKSAAAAGGGACSPTQKAKSEKSQACLTAATLGVSMATNLVSIISQKSTKTSSCNNVIALLGQEATLPGSSSGAVTACPTDTMVCPDGSIVGRIQPSCTFAPCPGSSSSSGTVASSSSSSSSGSPVTPGSSSSSSSSSSSGATANFQWPGGSSTASSSGTSNSGYYGDGNGSYSTTVLSQMANGGCSGTACAIIPNASPKANASAQSAAATAVWGSMVERAGMEQEFAPQAQRILSGIVNKVNQGATAGDLIRMVDAKAPPAVVNAIAALGDAVQQARISHLPGAGPLAPSSMNSNSTSSWQNPAPTLLPPSSNQTAQNFGAPSLGVAPASVVPEGSDVFHSDDPQRRNLFEIISDRYSKVEQEQ